MLERTTHEGLTEETEASVIESLERIVRSPNRVRILDSLHNNDSLSWTDLREECDVSRTTLKRNLESLRDAGWIDCSNREYRITPCGNLVAEQLCRLIGTTALASRLQDGLRLVPVDELDLDLGLLRDADVLLPDPGDPLTMINHHVRKLRTADTTRAALRITGLHAAEAAHHSIVRTGGCGEVIATPEVTRTLTAKAEYAPLTEEMLSTGRFDLFESPEPMPFSVVVIDGTTQLAVDEDGAPRAIIESEREGVREWANGFIDSFKRESQRVAMSSHG